MTKLKTSEGSSLYSENEAERKRSYRSDLLPIESVSID